VKQGMTSLGLKSDTHVVLVSLKRHPNSRQGVISIWDPYEDPIMFGKTKDIPCNNWIHFIVRDNFLHMIIAIRSNDRIWGATGINFFEWSVIQELAAAVLGVGVGAMKYVPTSFHCYETHYDRIKEIIRDYNEEKVEELNSYENLTFRFENSPLSVFDSITNLVMKTDSFIENDVGVETETKELQSLYSNHPNTTLFFCLALLYKRNHDNRVDFVRTMLAEQSHNLHPALRHTLIEKGYL
jgi:hypothetical protein